MMLFKYLLVFPAFLLLHLFVNAQALPFKSRITGKLADSVTHQVLKNATVKIVSENDSLISTTVLSGNDAGFEITANAGGTYRLAISYLGYETFHQKITVQQGMPVIDLGIVYLQLAAHTLQNVTVQTPPVTIKKDTVEFDANMYKTKPNGTVEDLLKKLSGVEVDKQGAIKAQGETVQRVLVDGKRFFGDDPKMATQNLPAEVVDKIQVLDQQSDQSAFTGFDDGNRTKTINIVTKKDKRKGYFGKFTGGVGDKGLYENGISLSKFNGNEQISFIGQGNNTNQQVFTIQDILGTFNNNSNRGPGDNSGGGPPAGGGGGNGGAMQAVVQGVTGGNNNNSGLTTTWAGGINYRNSLSKNTELYGSYFYNDIKVATEQKSLTENLIKGDSSQFNNQDAVATRRNKNQRFNFNFETQFDSANSLIVRPNISYQNTGSSSATQTDITKGKLVKLSNTTATANQQNEGYNGTVDALYRHKFAKKGRTFSLGLNWTGNSNNGTGNNFSVLDNFQTFTVDTTNQHYISKTDGNTLSTTLSYTEPIAKNQLIEINYNNSFNKNNANRTTYDYDSANHNYNLPDTALTNNYQNTYSSNRVGLNYLLQGKNMNLSAGSGVQFGDLTSINQTKNSSIKQHYVNLYPTANFNYRFSKTQNLRFNYSGRTTQPGVQQLQPVRDESDPTNIKTGNPGLKQEFTHSLRLFFTSFDVVHFTNLFASLNASFINNDIVNATTIQADGVQVTSPVNMNGAYNINGFFNYGFALKKPKSNLNFSTNVSHSKSVSMINQVNNNNLNYTMGETVRWTTNLKDKFDMNLSFTPTYNIAKYSVNTSQNAHYFSHAVAVEGTYYTHSGWILSSDFDLTAYTGRSAGYNTTVPLWNASLSRQIFKNKSGEIKFAVYDLLNRNVSITRNVTENYIQDVQSKVLTRYFLVSFVFHLRNFGQQKMPGFMDMFHGGGPPPGMPPPGGGGPGGPGGGGPPPGGPAS